MKPENSSATDRGRNQQRENTSGKTVPPAAIPPDNRQEEGVKREFPESARRPGVTDPKVKAARPGQGEAEQRGLHR